MAVRLQPPLSTQRLIKEHFLLRELTRNERTGVGALLEEDIKMNGLLEEEDDIATFTQTYLSPYLKYKAGTTTSRADRAVTTLYAPYYGTRWAKLEFPSIKLWPLRLSGFVPKSNDEKDLLNTPDSIADGYLDLRMKLNPDPSAAEYWANKICKVKTAVANVLGTNLFTGLCPTFDEAKEMASPQALACWHNAANSKTHPDAWPVLTIVAGLVPVMRSTTIKNKTAEQFEADCVCCGDGRIEFYEDGKKVSKDYKQVVQVQRIQNQYVGAESNLALDISEQEADDEPREDEIKTYLLAEKAKKVPKPIHSFASSPQSATRSSGTLGISEPVTPFKRPVMRIVDTPLTVGTKSKVGNAASLAT